MRRASAPDINPFALQARLSHRLQIHGQLHRHRPAVAGHAGAGSQRHHAHRPNPARHPAAARSRHRPRPRTESRQHLLDRSRSCMAGSRDEKNDTRPTDKRKPASSYKRKPASGLKPNTGNLAHDNRKSDVEIPEASFHPLRRISKKNSKRKNFRLRPRFCFVGLGGDARSNRIEKMLVMPTFRTRPIPTPTNRPRRGRQGRNRQIRREDRKRRTPMGRSPVHRIGTDALSGGAKPVRVDREFAKGRSQVGQYLRQPQWLQVLDHRARWA